MERGAGFAFDAAIGCRVKACEVPRLRICGFPACKGPVSRNPFSWSQGAIWILHSRFRAEGPLVPEVPRRRLRKRRFTIGQEVN